MATEAPTAPPAAAPAPTAPVPAAQPTAPDRTAFLTTPTAGSQKPRPANDAMFAKIKAKADAEYQDSSEARLARKNAPSGDKTGDKEPDTKAVEEAKKDDKPPETGKTLETKVDKTGDKPAETEFPDESAAGKMRAGELSRHYKALRKEHGTLKAKLTAIEAERAKGPTDDPERTKLTETLAEREKRVSQLEEIVRFKAYEESGDYKEKYEKPYIDAFGSARNKIASLRVIERKDGDTGEITQPRRQATAEDFDRLFRITDDSDAGELAEQLFGPNASAVLYHREKVLELNEGRLKALETFRKEGGEMEKKRMEQNSATMKQISEQANKSWTKHVNSVLENPKLAPLFKPIEGDDEANKLLETGYQTVREAFKNMNALDTRLTAEQREKVIESHTEVFNKAAAFDRVSYLLGKERKAKAALEQKLKAYEESEPTPGDVERRGAAPTKLNPRDHIYAALEKRAVPVRQ